MDLALLTDGSLHAAFPGIEPHCEDVTDPSADARRRLEERFASLSAGAPAEGADDAVAWWESQEDAPDRVAAALKDMGGMSMTQHDMAWHGMTWQGMAWHGMAWHVMT